MYSGIVHKTMCFTAWGRETLITQGIFTIHLISINFKKLGRKIEIMPISYLTHQIKRINQNILSLSVEYVRVKCKKTINMSKLIDMVSKTSWVIVFLIVKCHHWNPVFMSTSDIKQFLFHHTATNSTAFSLDLLLLRLWHLVTAKLLHYF